MSEGTYHSFLRLNVTPIANRLVRGAIWSTLGVVASRGLSLAAYIFVARNLEKAGYGQFALIQTTVGAFGAFAGFGLGITATKCVAEYRKDDPARAGRILTLSTVTAWATGGITALVLAALAPLLAAHTLSAPSLAPEVRIAALLCLLTAINGAQIGFLSGVEAFKQIAQINFCAAIISLPTLLLASGLYGLRGAVWGLVIAQIALCILSSRAMLIEARRGGIRPWSRNWMWEAHVLWEVSLPAVLASLLVAPCLWFSQALLLKYPAGYGGVAEFTVGLQWRGFLNYIPSVLCAAYLPVAASTGTCDLRVRRRLMLLTALFAASVTAAASVCVFSASPWILSAYGSSYAGAKWILGLLLVAGIADAANSILLHSLVAAGKTWYRLLSNSLWAAVFIGLALLLVPVHQQLGLALAVCVAQWIHLIWQLPLALHALRKASEAEPVHEAPSAKT